MTAVQAATVARTSLAEVGHVLREAGRLVWSLLRWMSRHWRYSLVWLTVALIADSVGTQRVKAAAVLAFAAPAVVAVVWSRCWPISYERLAAGPSRRLGWRRWARRQWPSLARECGLSVQRPKHSYLPLRSSSSLPGKGQELVWVHPRLMDVTTAGNTLSLLVRARRGQTVDDLEKAASSLAASATAISWRSKPLTPSVLEVTMVMREELEAPAIAQEPQDEIDLDCVRMGRRQDGTDWRLQLRGRHTLVVGCSGSGKGSMLWNVCGGLAPAVKADLVRLWGVDLKKGVEIGMGRGLFHATADDMLTAIMCLARLLDVVDERGRRMAGITRLHEPAPGDPLHVLVIDELAALIGYSDPDLKREATRLLSIILTQGRALGVVVVGCVQDPRKETVTMRTLFTQTVALRLLSADETQMVLGDGMAALAPAHRISPAVPGTAWVIGDDGTVDRVRADYWPDSLIRTVAAAYKAPIVQDGLAGEARSAVADLHSPISWSSRKPRSPRAPRAPRLPRPPQQDSGSTGGEAA
jgi:S-DNA-T family DNA segregation ATPase FtsK/SpoIIIE